MRFTKRYPNGLVGDTIPFEGRIAAICDVYDALTSTRPYKKAWSSNDAILHIVGESGKAFDPALVSLFAGIAPACADIRQHYSDSLH